MKTVKIGFVGCGNISWIYLTNVTKLYKDIEVWGICDLEAYKTEEALATVRKTIAEMGIEEKDFHMPIVYKDMYEMFADPDIDIVLNITRPYQHFDVSMAALKAGKHVYSEKPLGITIEEGKQLVDYAKEHNLLLGGAPDTFMGAGIQTCRWLIESGAIGKPISVAACMFGHGMESWHPDPDFFFKKGGGPMLDMGPYYVTAMVNLIGCVDTVYAMTCRGNDTRTITSPLHFGETINVEVDTHVAGVMRFENGVIGTLATSWDTYGIQGDRIQVFGTKGTVVVPDPNNFGGVIKLFRPEEGTMKEVPLMFDYKENSRGLGLEDMAKALLTGRNFRANCNQTYHVLEIMEGFLKSGQTHAEVKIESRFEKSAPMIAGQKPGCLED